MRILIVATSSRSKIGHGNACESASHRVDYLELASLLDSSYVDYSSGPRPTFPGKIENQLGLDVRLALRAARSARDENCDLVFSMSERVAIPLSYVLPHHVKQVVLAHHLVSRRKVALLKTFHTAQRWSRVIVPTRAEVDAVRSTLGMPKSQVGMMYNTVDTRFYYPQAPLPTPDHILSLGVAHRDYPTLVRAMKRLPGVTCLISASSLWLPQPAGYGRVVLPSNVSMLPYVPPALHPARLAASRFVVVPIVRGTTHWSAGTNSIMQAQAMGKAVVATRNPGTVDYVRDGETGILVDEESPSALAHAIEFLWKNSQVAEDMGRRAREWAEARYSVDHWLTNITGVLQAV